jgi:hypothetical protein
LPLDETPVATEQVISQAWGNWLSQAAARLMLSSSVTMGWANDEASTSAVINAQHRGPAIDHPDHQPVFQGEFDPTPSHDTQVFLPSGIRVQGADVLIGRLAAAA